MRRKTPTTKHITKTNSNSLEKSSGSICHKKKRQMLSILSSWDGGEVLVEEKISKEFDLLCHFTGQQIQFSFQEAVVPGRQYFLCGHSTFNDRSTVG